MNKDETHWYAQSLAIGLAVFWFMAMSMHVNGADWPGNPAWILISYIRWILTGLVLLSGIIWALPKWIDHSNAQAKKRQEAFDRYINEEVERRLAALRKQDKNYFDYERKEWFARQRAERAGLEEAWRQEFESKLQEECRLTQTADDAVEKAFNDFI